MKMQNPKGKFTTSVAPMMDDKNYWHRRFKAKRANGEN